jgi:hypothetical protein
VTDEDDDRPLSPEQESRIRSGLAAARATEPTPDHVAARLDATLADLVAEREHPAGRPSGSRPAGNRPARRTGRWVLLAGAASVAAIAAFTIPSLNTGQGNSSTAGSDSAKQAPAGAGRNAPSAQAGSGSKADTAEPRVIRLSTGSFRADVRRQLPTIEGPGALSESTRKSAGFAGQRCEMAKAPSGVAEQRPVLLDGRAAVLEVFDSHGGTRLVRAVSCGGQDILASTRVPAR